MNAPYGNGIAVLAAAALAVAGCGAPSGPTDAGDRPASLAVSAAFTGSSGDVSASIRDAFLAADSLDVQLYRVVNDEEQYAVDRTVPLDSGDQMSVPLEISLDGTTATFNLDLTVWRGADDLQADDLFRAFTEVTLRPGVTSRAEVTLIPVAAAVEASPDSVTIAGLSDTVPAAAAVLFATGDTIPPTALRGQGVTWSSRNPQVVEALDDGRLVSTYYGSTVVDVRYSGFGDRGYYGSGSDTLIVDVVQAPQ